MTVIEHLVETPLARALGWTLVHSLWEGAVIALVLLAALFVIRSARARYAVACAAMLGVLAAFVVTLCILAPQGKAITPATPNAIPRAPLLDGDSSAGMHMRFRLADVPPWLAPFWMVGVLLFHLRSAFGWMAAGRLRRRGVCGAPEPWPRRLEQLRARLRLTTPVVLLETCLADVPVVIGYLRPVILVPIGLLAGMPASQAEAILMHELAHIGRRDYLANLLQTVVESFLFYHPAIWWISGVVRAEREKCCDDLVVAASGDAREYAAALAALEQTRWAANEAVLAATGGSLVKRIHRLLYPPKASALAPVFSAGILMIAAVGALAGWQAQSAARPAATQTKVDRYTRWVNEDVVYIIDDRERAAFQSLKTDPEREHFISQFWERRNPTPGSRDNTFRDEHYRRIGYADMHYEWQAVPGWKTDRGRIYITYGPPDEIEFHSDGRPAGGGLPAVNNPFEQWRYRSMKGIGTNVIVDFEDTAKTGEFRMTMDPNPGTGVKR
ncbi:MAG TPA: GWxTD domain-containing protein [Bryobacteraceae bacterium]|nr:GWxTD domain-containing protein [Bryobacteraceae bacterium]